MAKEAKQASSINVSIQQQDHNEIQIKEITSSKVTPRKQPFSDQNRTPMRPAMTPIQSQKLIEPSLTEEMDLSDEDDKIVDNNEIKGIEPKEFKYDCNFFKVLREENQDLQEQSRSENSLAQS